MLKSRLLLFAGFGGLLAIIALSGFDALHVLSQFRKEDDEIRHQFLFRNRVLNNIRAEVYLSGTYVRDYLLEPDPERASGFGASLEDVRRRMETELSSYAGQLEPVESGQYGALQTELAQYWAVLEPILKWDARKRQAQGYAFLRDDVFPRRTAMLEVAGRIADINEQQLNAGNVRASGLLQKFQTRLVMTLFAALALGLGMAAFSTRKILQLEAHALARYQEVEEARKQLTHLSARLVEAQETERRSLSRELHDEVGQSLSAVLVELRNLLAGLGSRPEEQIRSQAEVIKGLVEGSIRSVRNMALLLRPSMLDDLGLIPALKWQAREVSKRTAMEVSVATELASEDLPDEYKTCIYRVVQEALHNCSRHSNASTVRVRVQQKPDVLLLSIQDDGRGFDVHQSKGLGLLGIEERVAQLGGTCHVHSGPGIGTILTVELPFHPPSGQLHKDQSETDSHPVSG
ncbi:MAG: MCP four helix bundle domain-containing protein [Acidobacteriia bacterium]|nr:MCP four helix bundle domain-containing protein [Terriglobia bacterium]